MMRTPIDRAKCRIPNMLFSNNALLPADAMSDAFIMHLTWTMYNFDHLAVHVIGLDLNTIQQGNMRNSRNRDITAGMLCLRLFAESYVGFCV